MTRPPPCPRCGEPTHELNEALTAGTQGTAQCARCGAVFTYHREAEDGAPEEKRPGDDKPPAPQERDEGKK